MHEQNFHTQKLIISVSAPFPDCLFFFSLAPQHLQMKEDLERVRPASECVSHKPKLRLFKNTFSWKQDHMHQGQAHFMI